MTTPDRDAERTRWTASAAAWERWADPMADLADRINQPLLDAAGVTAGDRVLDLACGAGEPALSAARRAVTEADGLVVGTDLVPAMAEGAARRAASTGAAVSFAAADMTALPFAGGSFSRVVCRFGIMFVPDAMAALAEVRRVLRPGGTAAFMVWGPLSGNALLRILNDGVDAVLGPDDGPGLGPLFRYAEAGSLETAMGEAGFTATAAAALMPEGKARAGTPFWKAQLEMSFGTRLEGLDPARRAAVEASVDARFRSTAVDGTIPLPVHIRIVTGRA